VVGRWWALMKDVGGREKWSPGVISRWFKLDGAAAPSADEGRAVHRLGQQREGFTVASNGEQGGGQR
jgi:hypothetical protein